MSLCKNIQALIQAVTASLNPLITIRSLGGVVRYLKPTTDTPILRSALLLSAVAQAQSGDVIRLESGAFVVPSSLTASLQPGVTGVSIVYREQVTYRYTDNEQSVADYALFPWPQQVGSQTELISALSGATAALKEREILMVRDIDLTTSVAVPVAKTLTPAGHRLRKGSGGSISVRGLLNAEPRQVFENFPIMGVTGPLRNEELYPEWWGLVDDNHDIAINCALQTSGLMNNQSCPVVKLSPRDYMVSHDIDMGNTQASLVGCGSGVTRIVATSTWSDRQWLECEVWPPGPSGPNHGSIIWIGNSAPLQQFSFRCKVKGMDIVVNNASFAPANWGSYRISGISSRFGIEEQSVIHDVLVSYASGFGIGSGRHKVPATGIIYPHNQINGLDISSVWIQGNCHRDSKPIYFNQWTNNCTFRDSTVDAGIPKSVSSEWNVVDSTPAYPNPPPQICTYPEYAIVASGNVVISAVHIEGAMIGVFVPETDGAPSVHIESVKAIYLMDRVRGAVYELDGRSGAAPPGGTPSVYDYGCMVVFAGRAELLADAQRNLKGNGTLSSLYCIGACTYMLRDWVYDVHLTPYGKGQFPALGSAPMAFYTRGNAYGPASGSTPGAVYNFAAPATDRDYFLGPIF